MFSVSALFSSEPAPTALNSTASVVATLSSASSSLAGNPASSSCVASGLQYCSDGHSLLSSLLYSILCLCSNLISILSSATTVPSVPANFIFFYSGLSLPTVNVVYRLALLLIALRLYCYCRVTVLYHKEPVKIPYVSPISKKLKEIGLDTLVNLSCPSFKKGFWCNPLLITGHTQTLWASLFADYVAENRIDFHRELITAPDGGVISLDWTKQPSESKKKECKSSKPNVYLVICHGLTGGSHETYVQELVELVKKAYGYESIVMNFRGCSGTPVKTPQLYAGSYTGDVELSIKHIKSRDPTAILFGVGFSLGSNVMTKFSGQKGKNCPLVGMASVGNPYDFLGTTRALHRSFIGKYLYSAALSKSLIRMFSKHANVFKHAEWLDLAQVLSSKTVQDFDAAATIKQFGYATVHEYYRFGSSAQDIPYIKVPALFLTAIDDPISNKEVIPYVDFASNPYVVFAATRLGGHLGWFEASWDSIFIPKHRWFARPLGEFIHAIVEVRFHCLALFHYLTPFTFSLYYSHTCHYP